MGADQPRRIRRALALALLALAMGAAGCGAETDAAPPPAPDATTTSLPPDTDESSAVAPTPAVPSSVGTTITQQKPAPGGGGQAGPNPRPCAGGGYPTAACTGVPGGVALQALGNNSSDGLAYFARKPGEVIDGKHIRGDLVIEANNVIIKNSLIEGRVINEYDRKTYPFTITDSTVSSTGGCHGLPGIGQERYRATRVLIKNHPDGFRVSGPDVTIEDSFVKLCSSPGDHSDGIDDYPEGSNLIFRHNTVDQRNAPDHTAPIFIVKVPNTLVADNLVMGGTYSLRVYAEGGGPVSVQNNRVVNKTWDFGPVNAHCNAIKWSGNELVDIDANYVVTKVVGPLGCG